MADNWWQNDPVVEGSGGGGSWWQNDPIVHPAPQSGILSNNPDDGYASGIAKGAATGAIKGLSNIPGTGGNLGNFADYLLDRAEAAITGKPLNEVQAKNRATLEKVHQDQDKSLLGRCAPPILIGCRVAKISLRQFLHRQANISRQRNRGVSRKAASKQRLGR